MTPANRLSVFKESTVETAPVEWLGYGQFEATGFELKSQIPTEIKSLVVTAHDKCARREEEVRFENKRFRPSVVPASRKSARRRYDRQGWDLSQDVEQSPTPIRDDSSAGEQSKATTRGGGR
jgi:hypothetical protein